MQSQASSGASFVPAELEPAEAWPLIEDWAAAGQSAIDPSIDVLSSVLLRGRGACFWL